MKPRNCLQSDILLALGGTIEDCQGTRNEILNKIYVIMGGSDSDTVRNDILEDILGLI